MWKKQTAEPSVEAGNGGLLDGTEVMTLDGVLPVSFLCPGDKIITRSGAATLARVETESRVCGVIRLRLGDGRLARFASGTKMRHPMSGGVVPAGAIPGAVDEPEKERKVFHLVLEQPGLIYAAGCEVMSAEHIAA